MSNIAYIVKESGVTLFKDGKQFSAPSDFWSFDRIIAKIKKKDYDGIESLFNANDAMAEIQKEIVRDIVEDSIDIRIIQGEVFIGDRKIYNSVTGRLIKMVQAGFDVKPLCNFLKRLLKNPSKTAIEELYPFMEKADVTIDKDGYIIAYKKVKHDYFDIYSGTVNYNIGNIVEMPRNEVDDNRTNLCSDGLHFCSFSYLGHFGSSDSDNRVLIVKVDPADVVSIPADYNDAKARACRMEVIGEVTEQNDVLARKPVYEKSQSAPARLTENVASSGRIPFVSTYTFNQQRYTFNQQRLERAITAKAGQAIFIAPITSAMLESETLKDITAMYNDLVSVYNVIQDVKRVPSIAMFKCSKSIAIGKFSNLCDEIRLWHVFGQSTTN